jgi:hypothetical protein
MLSPERACYNKLTNRLNVEIDVCKLITCITSNLIGENGNNKYGLH